METLSTYTTPNVQTVELGDCIGGPELNWLCTYHPQDVPMYLEFGGALAAVGLILAVYQLRKPKWDIVLSMRPFWQRWVFVFLGLTGLVLVLLKVIIFGIAGVTSLPVINPVLFDVAAYITFVLSPLSLLLFSEKSNRLFSEKNARRFYETLVWEVSTSDESRQIAALNILLENLEDICKVLKTNDRSSERYKSAVAVFDVILSEDSIVEYLTTKKLNSLVYIFNLVEKYGINKSVVNVGVPSLIRSLLLNNSSFAYKHRSNEGISQSVNIYHQVFESPRIISGFNLFGYPSIKHSWRGRIDSTCVNVLTEALGTTIETYYTKTGVSVNNISEGFELLCDIYRDTCINISLEEDRGVDTSREMKDEWEIIQDISRFLNHSYLYLAHHKELREGVVDHESQAQVANINSSHVVNEAYAHALFKCLQSLTYIPKQLLIKNNLRVDILHGLMFKSGHRVGYEKPFTEKLWKKIFYNVRERRYPAVLMTYLDAMVYFLTAEDKGGEAWVSDEARKLRRLLYLDLKPLFVNREEMVNDKLMEDELLPASIKFVDGEFVVDRSGKFDKVTKITPPPEGETAMMEGFEPEEDDRAYWWSD